MDAPTTPIPTFLNKEFFQEALDPENKKNLVICELNIVRNDTGGNYSSDIYRAKVDYTIVESENTRAETAYLLVKDLLESVSEKSCEYFTYTKILPTLTKILTDAGIERPALSPNLYLARKSKNEVHVFDDLNQHGYTICDRLIGFNLAQSKKIMEKLAHFHAASMIFKRKHPEIVAELNGYFWLDNPQFATFIAHVIDGNTNFMAPIVSQWPGYEHIAQKMLKNTGKIFEEKVLALFDPKVTKIRVLTHTDLWIKNILILEGDDKTVLDAVFIDYQNCLDGSPAVDINNFLMTSVQLDVLRNERAQLIEYYYNVLIETLKKCQAASLNIDLPTFNELLAEIQRTEYYTYYDLIFAFPQTNLSEELAKDMDYAGLFEPKRLAKNRQDMFSNPRVLDTFKFVLKRLDELGVLD